MTLPVKAKITAPIILVILIINSPTNSNKLEDTWRDVGRMTGLLLQNCMQLGANVQKEQLPIILIQCIKRRSLLVLDRSLDDDVIKLTNGIELIRYRPENNTHRSFNIIDSNLNWNKNETDWNTQVLDRLAQIFNTHVLKIRLNTHERPLQVESRGRRKRHSMMLSLIMFGVVAVGLVVIPMGFQFLAVLGGKALLLAKMALLLTTIQGLKKIATSNLNYGLYSTDHGHGHCKDELCNREYNPLDSEDSVLFSIDVDDLFDSSLTNEPIWHSDRQWPFETQDHHDLNKPYNYYDAPDQQTDLLHPFQPRKDAYKNIM